MTQKPVFETNAKTGPRCPVCGKNDEAEGGPVNIEGDMAMQEIRCRCGALYHEWYTYSNAILLEN